MRLTGPTVLPTIRSYQEQRQARRQALLDRQFDDGTYVGFILGVLASGLVWLVLSGTLAQFALWAAWTWLTLLDGRV